jgi:hypothetical protein
VGTVGSTGIDGELGFVVWLGQGKQAFITWPGFHTQDVDSGSAGGDGIMEGMVASVVGVGALIKSAKQCQCWSGTINDFAILTART